MRDMLIFVGIYCCGWLFVNSQSPPQARFASAVIDIESGQEKKRAMARLPMRYDAKVINLDAEVESRIRQNSQSAQPPVLAPELGFAWWVQKTTPLAFYAFLPAGVQEIDLELRIYGFGDSQSPPAKMIVAGVKRNTTSKTRLGYKRGRVPPGFVSRRCQFSIPPAADEVSGYKLMIIIHAWAGDFAVQQVSVRYRLPTMAPSNKLPTQEAPRQLAPLAFSEPPSGWPLSLWNACWSAGPQRLDFTASAWSQLPLPKQVEYSKSYQVWYARVSGRKLTKTVPCGNTVMLMRLIPPGSFWRGAAPKEPGRNFDESRHRVRISRPFYLGKYEITQQQWLAVMGENPANFKNAGVNAPVEWVSWQESREFCRRTGVRLPSEAEWEYACRAGSLSRLLLGRRCVSMLIPGIVIIVRDDHTRSDKKKANAWGCYDIVGNVWEWCHDWYGVYPQSELVDPQGAQTAAAIAFGRGGQLVQRSQLLPQRQPRERTLLISTISTSDSG